MKSDPLLPAYDPNRPVGDRIRDELRTRREVDPIVRQKLGQVQQVREQTFQQMEAEIRANRRSGALSFVANEDRSPADAADVANLSRRFNLPSEVIAADPTIWRQRAKREDAATASAVSTKLPQWTAKEKVRAAIITDDLDNLLRVEQALSPEVRASLKKRAAQRQQIESVLSDPTKATEGGNLFSSIFSLLGADTLSAEQESASAMGGVRSIGGGIVNTADIIFNSAAAQLADAFGAVTGSESAKADALRLSKLNENISILQAARRPEYSDLGGMVYDGFNSLALMAPGLAASIATRSERPALAAAYVLTQPEAYTRYRARGGTPGEAFMGSTLEGVAEVAFEKLPLSTLVNRFGKEATGKWIGEYLIKEGLTEQATTFTQDLIDTAIANPDKTWGEFWAERPEAALRTLVATGVASGSIGALNTTVNTIGGRMAQRQSRADAGLATAAFAEDLQKLAQASKVKGRDTATFESWVREASDGTQAEAVYIEAQKLVEVLEQSGLDEQQIIEALPSLQETLGEAMATNGDVRIPIEEFAARAEKLAPGLIPHLRIDPDDMSQAEAETYMQSATESMAAEAEAIVTQASNADEFRASAERVKANVAAQLQSAGRFTTSTNDAYASLHANFFARLAQRAGTTPEEMAARYPLQIQADVGQGVNVLEQGGPAPLEGMPTQQEVDGTVREFGPLAPARAAAQRYATQANLPYTPPTKYAKVDTKRAARIAQAFDEMEHNPNDPEVALAYGALVEETLAQWETIKATGLEVEFITGADPYGNPRNAILDVTENNHLWVFPTDSGFGSSDLDVSDNPLLAIVPGEKISGKPVRVNDIFRIVHDYFGHIKEGVGFRAVGEENAWRIHSAMYSPLARKAMTTETRGQNSWVNYGPHGEANRKASGEATIYAPQKIGLLPDWVVNEGATDGDVFQQGARTELESPPVDEEGYIELQHWAVEDDLATLDPSRWGRAGRFLPPEELSRTKVAPPRTYFGIATGQPGGYRNEFKEGSRSLVYGERYEYRARIKADRLYDMNADPLDLKAKGRALPKNQYGKYIYPNPQPLSNGALDGVSLYEQLIKDAGFDGYWIKNGSIGMVAAVFVPTEAERSTYNQDAPIFYSALARAVSTSKQAKAKASQWKGILQNAPGVKAEELEWSGLLDALDFDPDRVMTREELAEVVDKGGIVVDEVVLANLSDEEKLAQFGLTPEDTDSDDYESILADDGIGTQFQSWSSDPENGTYRELLMTLPIGSGGNPGRAPSTHWDQPNVVAHVRFMEKKDADGRRVLFIEEVQSDWHQKGRDQGYETKVDPAVVAAAQAKYDSAVARWEAAQGAVDENLLAELQDLENDPFGLFAARDRQDLRDAAEVARNEKNLAGRELDVAEGLITNGGVPNAPFKSTWPALVMKRAIRWAVDNAYDKVAWTTGEQQADRYSLAEATGPLEITAPIADGGAYRVKMNALAAGRLAENGLGEQTNDYGGGQMTLRMTPEQMAEAFGNDITRRAIEGANTAAEINLDIVAAAQAKKEKANRAFEDMLDAQLKGDEVDLGALNELRREAEASTKELYEVSKDGFILEGEDLKIGGEGMKAFYDRNLVNITNSLIKKYGAKVGGVNIQTREQEGRLQGQRQMLALIEAGIRDDEAIAAVDPAAERRLQSDDVSDGGYFARDITLGLIEKLEKGETQPGFDITPELATAASHGFPLFQRTGAPRGQISFGTDITASPTTITLLRGADLSTFLHESGHFFLEVMADMAKLPDAPKEIVDDLNIFLRWSGVKDFTAWRQMSTQEKRDHHERFARAFEAYLYEGRAPSIEMQGLFGRFGSWLLNVYKSLANLNVEMTDEVRGVFDRMLASETQVQEAQAMAGMEPVYTAKPDTMSDPEWAAYQAAHMDATRDAAEELERRSLRDMRYAGNAAGRELKRLQKEVKAQRDAMRDEVTAEMAALPVYRAERYLRKGELDGETAAEQVKIQSSDLARRYEGKPELLEVAKRKMGGGKSGMLAKDGMTLDEAAEAFGFTSGDHFLDAYLGAQKFSDAVETEIDARMVERYGDLNSPEALREAVDKAIHNDVRGRFVATEYAMLAQAPGKPRALAAAARKVAQGVVARLRVRDVRPSQHEAAERRSGKAAADSAKKGNIAEAAAHKRSQLVSFFTAKAARDALDEVDKTLRYFRKFANEGTRKALDPAYRDQIDALLERFDLRASVTAKDAAKRASLLQWVERQREMGIEPVISEELLGEAQRLPYKELTIEQMRGLADAIRNIEHIARLKKKLLTAKDEREFADIVDEVADGIANNAFKKVPETIGAKTWAERVGNGVKDFFAMHRKMANMAHVMDGNQYGGPVWERFIRAMNERGDWQATQNEKATINLGKLFDRLKGQDTTRREFVPEINASISLEDRLMVALNLGNEANAQRLMDGDKWEQPQLNAVLAPLTQEHWDFVQATWDYINSFWPEIAAKELRVSGIAPEKVEATPFERQLEDGTTVSLRGGYFPIKYDPDRSSKAEADTAAEVLSQMTRGLYTAASTRRGHTKARAEKVERPVRKDFGVIFEHVNQVVHDLAWHEYLIDANRLLRAAPIDAAIREGYGPETLRWMRKALEDIAVGDIAAQNAFERAVNHLRAGVSVAGLGWNLWTSLLQPIGLTQSAARIGTKWVARGVMRLGGDAAKLENGAAWVYERSEMMRLRGKTSQREINEIRNQITSKSPLRKQVDKVVPAPVSQAVADSFFVLIAKAQMLADLPTWIGQYEKSLEAGQTEERAAALADQAVLDSQGGGQIKDLSGIQRGSPLIKLWTNFYSYFNVTYNLLSDRTQELKRVGPADLPYYAVDVLMLTALPSILTTLMFTALRGSDDDWEAEQLAKNIAKDGLNYGMGLMIGMREIGGALTGDAGYRGPAGARFFAEIANVGKQVEQGEVDEALFRSINNTAGILLHYPAGQVDRTVRGTQAMAEGEAGPLAPVVGPPRN